MGRPATVITLSESEKSGTATPHQAPQRRAGRKLACQNNPRLRSWRVRQWHCSALGTDKDVVSRWRQRFSKLGLLGLNDQPRTGRPRTISGASSASGKSGIAKQARRLQPVECSPYETRDGPVSSQHHAYPARIRNQAASGKYVQAFC